VMLSQENPQREMKSAETLGGSPVSLHIYVDDADKLFQRAIDAGSDCSGASRRTRKTSARTRWASGRRSSLPRWRTESASRTPVSR
jgi:hypothetical protein